MALRVSAQTVQTIPHHRLGKFGVLPTSFMEMSDSTMLSAILIGNPGRYALHKVDRFPSLEVTDSLYVEVNPMPWYIVAKNPFADNDNIFALFSNDEEQEEAYLSISHFDDQLTPDTNVLIVPIADFLCTGSEPGMVVDPNGDIILSYYDYYSTERQFARVGIDGTIKHQGTINTLINAGADYGPAIFREHPLRYCYWGRYYDPVQMMDFVNCYILDSLFNVTETYTLPHSSGAPEWLDYDCGSSSNVLMGFGEDSFLVARPYSVNSSSIIDNGLIVMKYDNDFNLLQSKRFRAEPCMQYMTTAARPIGLVQGEGGYFYLAYYTNFSRGCVSVVKMDKGLNVVWQRHCLEQGVSRNYGKMMMLQDEKIAIMGVNHIQTSVGSVSELFFIVIQDDYDGMEEQDNYIRPYLFYPNPAQTELHLQYSPDVTPTQIELYDLQGRLVRTQGKGLESISMEGLPAGQYLMKVTLENGKVYSDKVVKE